MNSSEYETVERVAFCEGQLILARRIIELSHYEGSSSGRPTDLRVFFDLNGQTQEILTIEDLRGITSDHVCNSRAWVENHEATFAQIIARLLETGRVITSADLFDFLDEKYGISVSSNLPRIERNVLRFLAGQFSLTAKPRVFDLSIDLDGLGLEIKPVKLT